jgi:hypothetical protein
MRGKVSPMHGQARLRAHEGLNEQRTDLQPEDRTAHRLEETGDQHVLVYLSLS